MPKTMDEAIENLADLYFARYSSGCVKERYGPGRTDGIVFAKQVLKEVPKLDIMDKKMELV